MKILDRIKLKKLFQTGAVPTQEDFESLIDSMMHKSDSGIISKENGLKLSPYGKNNQLISFFENLTDFKEKWSIEKTATPEDHFGLSILNEKRDYLITLKSDGKIGIKKTNPIYDLDISGTLATTSRVGNYAYGKVPADGNWYVIVSNLSECNIFEIVAKSSKKGHGLHSMIHAIAISTYGKSNNTIKINSAYYGSLFNKIDLRWDGDTFNYNLQIRTKADYGDNTYIKYHITKLWEDE